MVLSEGLLVCFRRSIEAREIILLYCCSKHLKQNKSGFLKNELEYFEYVKWTQPSGGMKKIVKILHLPTQLFTIIHWIILVQRESELLVYYKQQYWNGPSDIGARFPRYHSTYCIDFAYSLINATFNTNIWDYIWKVYCPHYVTTICYIVICGWNWS